MSSLKAFQRGLDFCDFHYVYSFTGEKPAAVSLQSNAVKKTSSQVEIRMFHM